MQIEKAGKSPSEFDQVKLKLSGIFQRRAAGSICVLTTHQKHFCCHNFPTTTEGTRLQEIHRESDILRVSGGALGTSGSLPFVFRHGPGECENLASHPKKKLSSFWVSFWIPFPTPTVCGGTPLAEAHSAPAPGIGQEFTGSSFLPPPLPPPPPLSTATSSPMNYMMLGSRINQCLYGGDRPAVVHLAARWDRVRCHSLGPAAHKGDTVESNCTASKFTGTCATVEIQTRTSDSSEERWCE